MLRHIQLTASKVTHDGYWESELRFPNPNTISVHQQKKKWIWNNGERVGYSLIMV